MRRISILLLLILLTAAASSGQVPRLVSYQAVLRDAGGDLVPDGPYDITFNIYDVETGGTALWTETLGVEVSAGIFNSLLGSTVPLDLGFDVQYWLGVSINGGPEMDPRTPLTSASYAFRAAVADSVTGGVAGSGWTVSGGDMYSAVAGNVGIGTDTPSRKLDVAGEAAFGGGLYARGSGIGLKTSAGGYGVWVRSGGQVGLRGQSYWGGLFPGWGPDVHVNTGGDTAFVWLGGNISALGAMPARLDFVGKPGGMMDPTPLAGVAGLIANSSGMARGHLVFYTASGAFPDFYPERMRISYNGNVGIGLTGPAERLDIAGALRLATTTSSNSGTIRWTGTDFEGYDGTMWRSLTGMGAVDGDWSISGPDMYSAVQGNVGIGTPTPTDLLEISGTYNNGLTLTSSMGGVAPVITINNGNNAMPAALSARDGYAFNIEYPNGNKLVSVDDSGNVGIGTDAPEEKLQVIGRINSKITGGETTALEIWGGSDGAAIDLLNPSPGSGLYFRTDGSDRLFIQDDGMTSIGGADAIYRLNILSSGGNDAKIRLEGDLDDDPSLNFQDGPGSQRAVIGWDSGDEALKLKAETGMGDALGINVKNGGFVGIGTVLPNYELHVVGDIYATGSIYGNIATADDGDWTVSGPSIYPASATNVGIGTSTPDEELSVIGIVRGAYDVAETEYAEISHGGGNGYVNWVGDGNLDFRYDGTTRVSITQSGSVGIGTSAPTYGLTVSSDAGFDDFIYHNGDANTYTKFEVDKYGVIAGGKNLVEADGAGNRVVINNDGYDVDFRVESDADQYAIFMQASNGYVGIGTSAPGALLDVDGTTRTDILEVNGSDLAEQFEISHGALLEPGSVVVIDDENPGRLTLTERAYDRRVAGVISGAGGIRPGLHLRQEGRFDRGQDVALTGRVMVLCDASFGPIEPGDRLTTSPTSGHAMRAADNGRAHGAVIGKAMTSLQQGRGLVLLLVQPQ